MKNSIYFITVFAIALSLYTLWEESGRVPLIISVPGMDAAGEDCERTVTLVDLYPTLVDLSGLPERQDLDGNSLSPLLDDPLREWKHPAITTYGYKNHAVRTERWRYIRYQDGTEELFDHDSDPNEWQNLAHLDEYKAIMASLRKKMPSLNQPTAPGTYLDKYVPHDFLKWAREQK